MLHLQRPLFLYDGGCRFCRSSARLVARLDNHHALDFLPMHDERARPYVDLVPEHDRFKSFHLIETTGAAHSRGAGVVVTLAIAGRTRHLGRLLALLRMSGVMTFLYELVARSRGVLGRFLPDRPGPIRFQA